MLCEKCKKYQADTKITKTVNGFSSVAHLCSRCAAQEYSSGNILASDIFAGMLGKLFDGPAAQHAAETCELCGCSYEEFSRLGKAGCPQCYTRFYERILPSLQRIHGDAGHKGKIPRRHRQEGQSQNPGGDKRNDTEQELKRRLERAVLEQDFETAAVLRDEIKALGKSEGEV